MPALGASLAARPRKTTTARGRCPRPSQRGVDGVCNYFRVVLEPGARSRHLPILPRRQEVEGAHPDGGSAPVFSGDASSASLAAAWKSENSRFAPSKASGKWVALMRFLGR